MGIRPITIGIVGCGNAARTIHLPVLRRHADKFSIVACTDCDRDKADAFCREVEATSYHDFEQLLRDDRVELVLVLTKPPSTHRDIALASLSHGKHVLVEKPMADTVAQCVEMVDAAKSSGRVLTVHQNRRWDVDFLTVQNALERGLVGDPRLIRNEFVTGYEGSAFDWGIHLVDQSVCLSRGRRFVEISATMARPNAAAPLASKGFFTARLRTDDGVIHDVSSLPSVQGTRFRPGVLLPRFVLTGTAGTLIQNWCQRPEDAFGDSVRFEGHDPGGPTPGDPPFIEAVLSIPDFYALLYDTIRECASVPVDPESARRSVGLWTSICESAAAGKMLTIDL